MVTEGQSGASQQKTNVVKPEKSPTLYEEDSVKKRGSNWRPRIQIMEKKSIRISPKPRSYRYKHSGWLIYIYQLSKEFVYLAVIIDVSVDGVLAGISS